MKIDRTYAIYFSPTYTSKKSAVSIARGLEGDLSEIDLTLKDSIPEIVYCCFWISSICRKNFT